MDTPRKRILNEDNVDLGIQETITTTITIAMVVINIQMKGESGLGLKMYSPGYFGGKTRKNWMKVIYEESVEDNGTVEDVDDIDFAFVV